MGEEAKHNEKSEKNDCIFCMIARGEKDAEKVYEDDNFFAIKDINPKAKGHTLIIPKKHFKTFLDIPNTLGNEMMEVTKKVVLDLMKSGEIEGFNLISNNYEVAGQVVPHVHLHIIPRRTGDGLKILV